MLEQIQIDGFMRIAEADMDLRGHSIHAICGDNEAGKSSLVEAIAFCLRGLSPRVKLKGEFEDLLFRGKKKGQIKLVMDGFDLTRAIKTGKLETVAPLDYHELLVDIQLGREQFGKYDSVKLRQMLAKTFNIDSSSKYIGERLQKKGITEEMTGRILPLLKAGGFESACQTAIDRFAEKRGAWEAVTSEKYGSLKSQDWEPKDKDQYAEVSAEYLDTARVTATAANQAYADANRNLGSLQRAAEVLDSAEQLESIEDIQTHLQSLVDVEKAYQDELPVLRQSLASELEIVDREVGMLNNQIMQAKMAVATLECPGCAMPLKVHTEGGKALLVQAEDVERRDGPSLTALNEQLQESQDLKKTLTETRTAKIRQMEKNLLDAQSDKRKEEDKLSKARAAAEVSAVTPEDVTAADQAVTDAKLAMEQAKSALAKLESDKANFDGLATRKQRADAIAAEAAQWSLAADLLSNKAESIPSELVQRTVGPINRLLMEICGNWNQLPFVVDASMGVSRGDGHRYALLSESARWRMDSAIQLALAALGPLKLVALDRFDVLAVEWRGDFFDMLEWYASTYPEVTVITAGTLKSKPDLGESIKSWWVQDGEISA